LGRPGTYALRRRLRRRRGVKTEFVVYPDEGHHFFRHADQIDVMTRVAGWFDANLGAGGR
jgi:dipeptidyl aminopeptidase/acylaminoacyl peptidase